MIAIDKTDLDWIVIAIYETQECRAGTAVKFATALDRNIDYFTHC
jgi:hypothetical protein